MRVAPPWKERKKECKCSVQSAGSSASKKVLAHRAGSPALEEEELQKRKCADFPAQEEQLDDWKNSKRKKKGKTESKERCAGTSAAPKRKIWFDDVAPVEDVEVGAGSSATSSGDSAGSSAAELKRLGRYLKTYPRAVQVFVEQNEPREVEGWVDSDYAGDVISRRSTSGLVIKYGHHVLTTSSSIQGPIGLSSGESEYYACVKGRCYLLGIRALLEDWGLATKLILNLKTDSSAAKGFAGRRGLGKQRHVSTRFLWLQDRIGKGDLRINKVGTEEQLADLLTKAHTRVKTEQVCKELGLEFREGKAKVHKGSLVQKEVSSTKKVAFASG